MSKLYIYSCIFLMAFVTYLIRIIPLVFFKKQITNVFIRSFLYYAPYVTLSVMSFPAILSSTGNFTTSLAGFLCIVFVAVVSKSFVITAFGSCALVLILEILF